MTRKRERRELPAIFSFLSLGRTRPLNTAQLAQYSMQKRVVMRRILVREVTKATIRPTIVR